MNDVKDPTEQAFSRIIVGGAASSDMRKHFRSLPVEYVTSAI